MFLEPKGILTCLQIPLPVSILSQMNPVYTTPSYLYKVYFSILRLCLPSDFFSSYFTTNII
jgi:hypothetical protein